MQRIHVILMPSGCSDVAADDAVGAVVVLAARAIGDLVIIFGVSTRGVGRNG